MSNETESLKPCPFCGGSAKMEDVHTPSPNEYAFLARDSYYVKCVKCGAKGREVTKTKMCDFTEYSVSDFRDNPVLRAEVLDKHEKHLEAQKKIAVDKWNARDAEVNELRKEVERLNKLSNAAIKYIDECPCDPDIYPEQLEAWEKYLSAKESKE